MSLVTQNITWTRKLGTADCSIRCEGVYQRMSVVTQNTTDCHNCHMGEKYVIY